MKNYLEGERTVKKFFIFWLIFFMIVATANAFTSNKSQNEIKVLVIDKDKETPLSDLTFNIKVSCQTDSGMEVKSNKDGIIRIDSKYEGCKIMVYSDEINGQWTEIKPEGTVVKCGRTNTYHPTMINPWGHSRPSPPKPEKK